jgi:hypothetical protein
MTPLETLQALKIKYDIAKDRFETLIRMVEAKKNDKEFVKLYEDQTKFYGKLQEDLAFVILDIQTDIDPRFLKENSKFKPKLARENPMSDL